MYIYIYIFIMYAYMCIYMSNVYNVYNVKYCINQSGPSGL